MDPDTSLVVFGSAALVVQKILGPTADVIGQGVAAFATKRLENVKNIFTNAAEKLGDAIDEEIEVPMKVLGRILDEGSYASDPVATEYFGGILASSRSGIKRDDRGATMAALVGRLSVYQLRSHYIFYSVAHRLLQGRDGSGIQLRPPQLQSCDAGAAGMVPQRSTLPLDGSSATPAGTVGLLARSSRQLAPPHCHVELPAPVGACVPTRRSARHTGAKDIPRAYTPIGKSPPERASGARARALISFLWSFRSERSPRLAGALGAAVTTSLLRLGWFSRRGSGRRLHVSRVGVRGLINEFGAAAELCVYRVERSRWTVSL